MDDTKLNETGTEPEIGSPQWKENAKNAEIINKHGGHRKGAGRPKLSNSQKNLTASQKPPSNIKQNRELRKGYRQLVKLVPKSIQRLAEMLTSSDDAEALKAIQLILQRTLPEIKQKEVVSEKPNIVVFLPEKDKTALWQDKAKQILETRARKINDTDK